MKKLVKLAVTFTAISIALAACTSRQTYDKNGISFSYPKEWSVTVDEFSGLQGYLMLEKGGSSTKMIVGWLNSDVPIGADIMLENAVEGLAAENALADLVLTEVVGATFGTYPARSLTYTATTDGVPQSGTAWVFKAEGAVVNVAFVQAASDSAANVDVFQKITDSFELK